MLVEYLPRYNEEQRRRHEVRPGLSGLAQVNGRNAISFVNEKIIQKNKTHVLAGAGVDLKHFYYAEYPEEDDIIRFLFIGRVMREKGIDELFQVMQKLNENLYVDSRIKAV